MKRSAKFALYLILLSASTAQAVITTTGNVNPTDPGGWTSSTIAYVGKTSSGTLSVNDGDKVFSYESYLGHALGTTGAATISGTDSIWNNQFWLNIGYEGTGQLTIVDGGEVSCYGANIGYATGSIGVVNVSGSESVWSYKQTSPAIPVIELPPQDLVLPSVIIPMVSSWNGDENLYVGQNGTGRLEISDGGKVLSNGAHIGYASEAIGTVNVSGVGSIWNASGAPLVIEIPFPFEVTSALTPAMEPVPVPILNLIPTPMLSDGGKIYVGRKGTGQLNIMEGATVTNQNSSIGYDSGSTGSVSVSGEGSTWQNTLSYSLMGMGEYIYVGEEGIGRLNITEGGVVNSNGASIGKVAGSIGTVTVSGSGSLWKNLREQSSSGGGLYVGQGGSGYLNITDAATVESRNGYIGLDSGSTGSVTISGNGSLWTTNEGLPFYGGGFHVGYEGSGQVFVKDGGTLSTSNSTIGYAPGSMGTVTVSGNGSTWNNSGSQIISSNVGSIYIGQQGVGQLNITDGGTVNSVIGFIGGWSGSIGTVNVSGTGSTWINKGQENDFGYLEGGKIVVGGSGTGTMNITDGGKVISNGGNIGSNGTVTVSGPDSIWTYDNSSGLPHEYKEGLNIGQRGHGILSILNGGTVEVHNETWLGGVEEEGNGAIHFDSGTLNTGGLTTDLASLTGTGTVNTHGLTSDIDLCFDDPNSSNLTIVLDSEPNQNVTIHLNQSAAGNLGVGFKNTAHLDIVNGANVESQAGYLGWHLGAMGTAIVAGNGSAWTISEELYIGGREGNGQLDIQDGATVNTRYVEIAFGENSTGKLTISGTGSSLNNGLFFCVGLHGQGQLDILDGAKVYSEYMEIAGTSSATGTITVDGSGSSLTSDRDLLIGSVGIGTLNILNHATVDVTEQTRVGRYVGNGTLCFDHGTLNTGGITFATPDLNGTGTINTHGLVSDFDLRFDADNGPEKTFTFNTMPDQNITIHLDQNANGDLGVGHTNTATLTIGDGRVIESNEGYLGLREGSTGIATISGNGTKWICHDTLYVGHEGSGALTIAQGATVNSRDSYVGGWFEATSTVTITGKNSLWNSGDDLTIADIANAQIDILDGGTMISSSVEIADHSESTAIITISGEGSNWVTTRFRVGCGGTAEIIITNGGTMTSDKTYLANDNQSTAIVTVSGIGSTWTNQQELYVGRSGNGILSIIDGAFVENADAYIGSSGTVNVSGNGSTWKNRNDLDINGRSDSLGELNIIDSGRVCVAGTLSIDYDGNFINMKTGGMLALTGKADESLDDFFTLIYGTDAIRWWDDSIDNWAPLTTAMIDVDYTLQYMTDGDLAGYTLLTVGVVPEPGCVVLLLTALLAARLAPTLKKPNTK